MRKMYVRRSGEGLDTLCVCLPAAASVCEACTCIRVAKESLTVVQKAADSSANMGHAAMWGALIRIHVCGSLRLSAAFSALCLHLSH